MSSENDKNPDESETTSGEPNQTSEPAVESGGEAAQGSAKAAEETVDVLEQARAEATRLKDQLLRALADFDNFRKRSRREIEDAQKRGREDVIRELLPVFDNLERAVLHAGQANDAKAVADGVNMVLKQFVDTLGKIGIQRINAVGQPFDPARHEAIQQIETAEHPAGSVVAEVQPGYAMGDRLLRASMVVVAKPPQVNGDQPPTPEPS